MLAEEKPLPHPDLSSGPHQALPFIGFRLQLAREEHLNASMKKFTRRRISQAHRLSLKSSPPSIQPRWKHPGVVKYDQIARSQQFGKLAKPPILESPAGSVEVQHPRGGAIRQWFLGNEFFRQMIVKFRDQHANRL